MRRSRAVQKHIGTFILAILAVFTLLPSTTARAIVSRRWEFPHAYWSSLRRWEGLTRYGTSEHVADETGLRGFYAGNNVYTTAPATWAVVVTGTNFPDALAASALAGCMKCNVLLANPDPSHYYDSVYGIDIYTSIRNVYVVGGEKAVPKHVMKFLTDNGVTNIKRVAGADRIATSIEVLKEVRKQGSKSDTIIVATGKSFADALAIGPWSSASMSPIILTQNNGKLRQDAIAAIKSDKYVKRILIVGETLAVSDEVKQQLGNSYTYERLGGRNRYQTADKIAAWTITQDGFHANYALIATGKNFPDALVSGAAGGLMHAPLYLSDGTSIPTAFKNGSVETHNLGVAIIGGEHAIDYSVDDWLLRTYGLFDKRGY